MKVYHVDKLANLLDSACVDWRVLASKLGLGPEETHAIEAGTVTPMTLHTLPALRHVPTVDVLRLWCKKPKSTIRILRHVLAKVASDDLVQKLDHFRMSKHTSTSSS